MDSLNSVHPNSLQKFKDELIPEAQMITEGRRYHAFIFGKEQTKFTVYGIKDLENGIVLSTNILDRDERIKSLIGWYMARYSRSDKYHWEILYEIVRKMVDSDKKLEETFVAYGHNSVADPADLTVDQADVPMWLAHGELSYSSNYTGQEGSTRFKNEYEDAEIFDLQYNFTNEELEQIPPEVYSEMQDRYYAIHEQSIANFKRLKALITPIFYAYYKADPENKKEISSTESRIKDCIRYLLLMGHKTKFTMKASAREFSSIIARHRASPNHLHRQYGEQIYRLLVPYPEEEQQLAFLAEAPGLIKHTEPNEAANNNLYEIDILLKKTNFFDAVPIYREEAKEIEQDISIMGGEFDESEKLLAQYIITLYPGVHVESLFKWIRNLSDRLAIKFSRLMFQNHHHHEELPSWAGTTAQTVRVVSDIGVKRDLFRHRVFKRFGFNQTAYGLPMTADRALQLLSKGYILPSYLTDIPEFAEIREEFSAALREQNMQVRELLNYTYGQLGDSINYDFMQNMFALGFAEEYWMHGTARDIHYLEHQRLGNGGHINYRVLSWKLGKAFHKSQRFFRGARLKREKPDPASREQFMDRS